LQQCTGGLAWGTLGVLAIHVALGKGISQQWGSQGCIETGMRLRDPQSKRRDCSVDHPPTDTNHPRWKRNPPGRLWRLCHTKKDERFPPLTQSLDAQQGYEVCAAGTKGFFPSLLVPTGCLLLRDAGSCGNCSVSGSSEEQPLLRSELFFHHQHSYRAASTLGMGLYTLKVAGRRSDHHP